MPVKLYFPDGFPKDPFEILEFIKGTPVETAIGDDGVEGWNTWLKESNPSTEDIDQFVEIVHGLWVEENPQATTTSTAKMPIQEPTVEQIETKETSASDSNQPNPFAKHFNEVNEINDVKKTEEPVAVKINKPIEQVKSVIDDVEIIPTIPTAFKNETITQNSPVKEIKELEEDEKSITIQSEDSIVSRKEYKTFDIKKARETATRAELDGLYKQYLDAKDGNNLYARSYFEAESSLMSKVMDIVVNFEQVSDYFESMTEKLLEMNDKIIQQGRDQEAFKSALNTRTQILEDKISIYEGDISRLTSELRDTKSINAKRYQEVSASIVPSYNDSFGGEGIKQRLDLLDAKIIKVSNQITTQKLSTLPITPITDILQNSTENSSEKISEKNIDLPAVHVPISVSVPVSTEPYNPNTNQNGQNYNKYQGNNQSNNKKRF
jgi:hypothetical protein